MGEIFHTIPSVFEHFTTCMYYVCAQSHSHVHLFATPWTAALQAPVSTGFSRQECWNGLPFPASVILSESALLSIIWRRQWQPIPALLPGKSHGWRSLVGCSPWGRQESDTTEQLHFHFSLLCIGEGNGNPLQCSCLENPRDGGVWWAAISGVTQSQTRLKQLSSSSSNHEELSHKL